MWHILHFQISLGLICWDQSRDSSCFLNWRSLPCCFHVFPPHSVPLWSCAGKWKMFNISYSDSFSPRGATFVWSVSHAENDCREQLCASVWGMPCYTTSLWDKTKCKSSPDHLHLRILRGLAEESHGPLNLGILEQFQKTGRELMLCWYFKGHVACPGNYRLVNHTSVFSKIMEKLRQESIDEEFKKQNRNVTSSSEKPLGLHGPATVHTCRCSTSWGVIFYCFSYTKGHFNCSLSQLLSIQAISLNSFSKVLTELLA